MKKNIKKTSIESIRWFQWCAAGAAVLALATLATRGSTAEIGGNDSESGSLRNPAHLQEQLREDVRTAIEKNAQASTLAEWQNSGFTAHDIFENARALRGWTELCHALSELPARDAALFEEEVRESTTHGELPCGPALTTKIEAHWQDSQEGFLREREEERSLLPAREAGEVAPLKIERRTLDPSKGETLSRGPLKAGEITLTFDDGPHPTRTQKILAALDRAGIKANFFSVGQAAKANPQLVREEVARGHVVGSHSHSHQNLPVIPLSRGKAEIDTGIQEVAEAAGVGIPFFRFPFGARNASLTAHVASKGFTSWLWNMDPQDWKFRDPNRVYQNAIGQLNAQKGGIILFHDVQEQTTIALPAFLEELARRKMTVVVFDPVKTP